MTAGDTWGQIADSLDSSMDVFGQRHLFATSKDKESWKEWMRKKFSIN